MVRRSFVFSLVVVLFGSGGTAEAIETRSEATIVIPAGTTLDDSLLAFGQTVQVDGIIDGDLIAFARRVVINGTVRGDIILFAQSSEIAGKVEGSAHVFNQTLSLGGEVSRSMQAFGQTIDLTSTGRVGGELIAMGSETMLSGQVGRGALAAGGTVVVRGDIARNLRTLAQRVEIAQPARIGGNLSAQVDDPDGLHIDPGATIQGSTESRVAPAARSRYLTRSFYLGQLISLAMAFITGMLFAFVAPTLFGSRVTDAASIAKTAGIGFLLLIAAPVAAILIALTVVGIPLTVMAIATWLTGLYLAKILVAALIGYFVIPATVTRRGQFAASLLVGLGLVFVVINLPVVGGWIHFAIILLGLGLAGTQAYATWKQTVVTAELDSAQTTLRQA